jgi:hypothetical protein
LLCADARAGAAATLRRRGAVPSKLTWKINCLSPDCRAQAAVREPFQLANKHEAAEAGVPSGKMSRKKFETKLAKLQVELARMQTWLYPRA